MSVHQAKVDLFNTAAFLETQGINPCTALRRGGVQDPELHAMKARAEAAEARVAELSAEVVERVLRAAEQLGKKT